jgi:hypothetical protein
VLAAAAGGAAATLCYLAAGVEGAPFRAAFAVVVAWACGAAVAVGVSGEDCPAWLRWNALAAGAAVPVLLLALLVTGIGTRLAAGPAAGVAAFLAFGHGTGRLSQAGAGRTFRATPATGLSWALLAGGWVVLAMAPLGSAPLRGAALLVGPPGIALAFAAPSLSRRARERLGSSPVVLSLLCAGLWLLRAGLPHKLPPLEQGDLVLAALALFALGHAETRCTAPGGDR